MLIHCVIFPGHLHSFKARLKFNKISEILTLKDNCHWWDLGSVCATKNPPKKSEKTARGGGEKKKTTGNSENNRLLSQILIFKSHPSLLPCQGHSFLPPTFSWPRRGQSQRERERERRTHTQREGWVNGRERWFNVKATVPSWKKNIICLCCLLITLYCCYL